METEYGIHESQWVLGALSLRVERTRREGDYSLPTSAEVNNA